MLAVARGALGGRKPAMQSAATHAYSTVWWSRGPGTGRRRERRLERETAPARARHAARRGQHAGGSVLVVGCGWWMMRGRTPGRRVAWAASNWIGTVGRAGGRRSRRGTPGRTGDRRSHQTDNDVWRPKKIFCKSGRPERLFALTPFNYLALTPLITSGRRKSSTVCSSSRLVVVRRPVKNPPRWMQRDEKLPYLIRATPLTHSSSIHPTQEETQLNPIKKKKISDSSPKVQSSNARSYNPHPLESKLFHAITCWLRACADIVNKFHVLYIRNNQQICLRPVHYDGRKTIKCSTHLLQFAAQLQRLRQVNLYRCYFWYCEQSHTTGLINENKNGNVKYVFIFVRVRY